MKTLILELRLHLPYKGREGTAKVSLKTKEGWLSRGLFPEGSGKVQISRDSSVVGVLITVSLPGGSSGGVLGTFQCLPGTLHT